MDTSKMKLLSKMTSGSSYELIEAVRELGRVAATLRDSLEGLFLREQIVEIVEELYDIGSVKEVYEIYGGYVNRKGAPMMYGSSTSIMDLRTSLASMGAPEMSMISASVEMLHRRSQSESGFSWCNSCNRIRGLSRSPS